MAEYIDGLGRIIQDEGTKLRELLRSQMSQSVKVVESFERRDEKRNVLLTEIKALLGQLTGISKDMDDASSSINSAASLLKEIEINKGKATQEFTPENIKIALEKASEKQQEIVIQTPHGKEIDVNISEVDKSVIRDLAIAIEDYSKKDQVGDEVLKRIAASGGKADGPGGRGNILPARAAENATLRNLRTLGLGIAGTTAAIAGGAQATDIFKGLIREELIFSKELARAAFTQKGITVDQKEQLEIFKRYSRSLAMTARTGKDLAENYKAQLKFLKRGIIDQEKFTDLSIMAASTATALNIDTEQLVDYYGDLSIMLGMTASQIARMGYKMRDFAKQTGISGEMLAEAAKATEEIRMNLLKSGSATPENIQGYVQMIATAMQQGAPQLGRTLGDSISKSFVQRMKEGAINDPATMMMIRSAGGNADLIQRILGGATTPEDMQRIMQDQMLQISNALGAAVPDEKKFFGPIWDHINKLRAGGQLTADESEQVAKFYDRNIVGRLRKFGMQQQEINQISMMVNKSIAMGQYELGEAGKQFKIMNSRAMQMVTQLDDLAMLAEQGLKDADFQAEIKNLGLDQKLKDVVKNLNEELTKKGIEGFGIDAKQIDAALKSQKAYDSLFKNIQSAEQALTTERATGTNILDDLSQKIREVNETMRDMISGPLEWLGEKIGATGLLFIGLAASIAAAMATIGFAILPLLRYATKTKVGASILGEMGKTRLGSGVSSVIKRSTGKGMGGLAGFIIHPIQEMVGNISRAGKAFGQTLFDTNTYILKNSRSIKGLKFIGDWIGSKFGYLGSAINKIITAKFPGIRKALYTMVLLLGSYIKSFKDSLMGLKGLGLRGLGGKAVSAGRYVKGSFVGRGAAAVGGRVASVGRWAAGTKWGSFVLKEAGVFARAAGIFGRGSLTAVKALTSWTGVIPLAISLAEGLAGALTAGAKANEIFGVSVEDLTTSQQAAAEGAGFLTGILNGLTFGFFDKWLGATGTWTVAIAKFLDVFWPLNVAFQLILLPLKILWGVLKGLWIVVKEVAVAFWEGLKEGLEPLGELWNTFNSVLQQMFPSLEGGIKGWVDISKAVASFVALAAKPLGFVFKWLGKIIGWLITVIGGVAMAIGGLIAGFVWVVKKVGDIVGSIVGWFQWLWEKLVGHSIIPDLIMGIIKFFALLPLKIPMMLVEAFVNVGSYVYDSITSSLVNLGTWMWENITSGLTAIKEWLYDWIPGLGDTVKAASEGFTQTTDEFKKVAAEGPSIAHGLGGMASIVKGDVGKAWEGTKETGSAIWEKTKAVASYFNPFNWFADGAREIQQGGVGVLHEGEMVVPRTLWENIKAIGSSAFGSEEGSFFQKAVEGVGNMLEYSPLGLAQKAVTALFGGENAEVRTLQPGSLSAEERIRQDKEGTSTTKVEVVNAGMDELTAINSLQAEYLANINAGIQKLVAGFSTTVGNTSSTRDKTATYATGNAKTNDYFESPFAYGNNYLTHQTIVQTGVG